MKIFSIIYYYTIVLCITFDYVRYYIILTRKQIFLEFDYVNMILSKLNLYYIQFHPLGMIYGHGFKNTNNLYIIYVRTKITASVCIIYWEKLKIKTYLINFTNGLVCSIYLNYILKLNTIVS